MGKVVKFCTSCDEGFAEKFSFCPNCAAALEAYEMNPLGSRPEPVPPQPQQEELQPAAPAFIAPIEEPSAPFETETVIAASPVTVIDEPAIEAAPVTVIDEQNLELLEEPHNETIEMSTEEIAEFETGERAGADEETEAFDEPETENITVSEPTAAATFAEPIYVRSEPMDADAVTAASDRAVQPAARREDFHVTVIEEKNSKQRNALLLGALGFMLTTMMSGLVYNIFSKDLEVGSINDDIFNAVLVDNLPMTVEEEQQKAADKKAGGGGGGGKDEKEELTLGDLANQSRNPIRPPDAKVFRSDNFELKTPPPQTEGDRTFEKKHDRWGDPSGRFSSWSDGTGTGGGQGTGTGTGQGTGRGTGTGSGTGSGSGGGLGSGHGDGTGPGGSDGPPPPPRPVGVTQALKINSKPRPSYTDSARQNNVQGTVILRVTFLASGQIGSISAVKGLPYGLTEQAIAAARRIGFEPAKRNGVGQSVTRQIEYTFSIY